MVKIAPSIFAAEDISKGIKEAELADCEIIHWDILDGKFVNNSNNLNEEVIANYRKTTRLFFDVHLMIEDPLSVIENYKEAGADSLIIHAEINKDIKYILNSIKNMNIENGIAINPNTSIETIEEVLPLVDIVLLMSVEPGYCGQKFITSVFDKIILLKKKLVENKINKNIKISIDGGINLELASKLKKLDVDVLVIGSFIYAQKDPIKVINLLKNA